MIIKNGNENFEISENLFSEILKNFTDIYLEEKDCNDFNNLINNVDAQNIFDWVLKKYRINLKEDYKEFIEIYNMDFDSLEYNYELKQRNYKVIYSFGKKIRFRNNFDDAEEIGNELANKYKNSRSPGDIVIQDRSGDVIAIKKFIRRTFDENEYNLLRFEVDPKGDVIIGENGFYTEWIMIKWR